MNTPIRGPRETAGRGSRAYHCSVPRILDAVLPRLHQLCPPPRRDLVQASRIQQAPTRPYFSMDYPIVHCRFLWGGYGHVLRSIRTRTVDDSLTSPSQLPNCLWQIERDPHVVGRFMRTLFKTGTLVSYSFLRFIAVHHVAGGVWGDLLHRSGGMWNEVEMDRNG
jgi:hypothetical protein